MGRLPRPAIVVACGALMGTLTGCQGPRRAPTQMMTFCVTMVRAGAWRLEAFHPDKYYVSYEPDPGLRWHTLDRVLAGKRPGAEVHPLDQRTADRVKNGFDVLRGGEIVGLAIARQLRSMGWSVGMVPPTQMLEKARQEFPERDLAGTQPRMTVTGDLWYRVVNLGRGESRVSVAHLVSTLRFALVRSVPLTIGGDTHATTSEPVFANRFQATERVTRRQEPRRTERGKRAAAAVLRTFVRRVFTDRRLEHALLDAMRRTGSTPAIGEPNWEPAY